ncbi:hypothetical protein C1H46_032274 [Malus baccata]|uniref:Protein kinase domain-containing protein n=1 Tax=Malus baccata TaxID=106549 RepID=A0A540L6S9_MALBA|nr:hypothetical protein C1H46_032274 [Malus baccata]
MEMDYVSEFPLSHVDWRPRKRPRFAWDPPQPHPKDRVTIEERLATNSGPCPVSSAARRTFGQVLECWDRETKEMVAIKVVRSIKKYREAAMIEVDVLQLLGKYDRNGSRCVQIRNWFDYRNHICIEEFHRNFRILRFRSHQLALYSPVSFATSVFLIQPSC